MRKILIVLVLLLIFVGVGIGLYFSFTSVSDKKETVKIEKAKISAEKPSPPKNLRVVKSQKEHTAPNWWKDEWSNRWPIFVGIVLLLLFVGFWWLNRIKSPKP